MAVIAHDKPPWTLDWVSTGLIGGGRGLFPEFQINRGVDVMRSSDLGELHATIPNHRARTLSDTNLKRIASAKPGAFPSLTTFG
jgi:hypothetical protein